VHYRIITVSDQKVLAEQAEVADTFLKRLRGLTFRAILPEGTGLLLRPCQQIHMMFMRFAIDAVFLDKNQIVVAQYPNLRPWWGITSYHANADMVLELPEGTLTRTILHSGDTLHFQEVPEEP
jgi:hypothetical protein